VILTRVSHQA